MTTKFAHNNMKSILPTAVEWINVLSTIYLLSTFILPFNYQRVALYMYFASLIVDIVVNRRYKGIKWHNTKYVFATMAFFYAAMWIWHLFEDCNAQIYFHSTDTRLPFLAFGLLGLTCAINPKIKISHIAYTMLVTSLIAIGYLAYKVTEHQPTTIEEIRTLLPVIRHKALHTTHIGLNQYLNCTIAICFIYIHEKRKKWNAILPSLGILIIYISLLLNEGRAGFIIANILIWLFIGITIHQYKPKFLIPSLMLVAIVLLCIASHHDRLNLNELVKEPRMYVWKTSIDIIKEKPILGHGVCQGKELFIERVTNNKDLAEFWEHWYLLDPDYNKNRFHCHNAFLESAVEFGLIGIIITLLIFLLPIIFTKNKRQLYLSFIILIFGIQAMVESFTAHYQIFLFCWLIYFFINTKLSESD